MVCPTCGRANDPDARFCDACGARLDDPRSAEARKVVTVVFTDVVGSTERARELEDHAWSQLLDRHHAEVRRQLEQFRGEEIDTAGDGFMALFDGPARAIHCAVEVRAALRELGLDIRAGVHTGEVERVLAEKPRGIAVHIGARVAARAAAGEVLVTSTTHDGRNAAMAVLEDLRGR
jgi:class 3 adenylate cyclase